jgi:hypothetical protein
LRQLTVTDAAREAAKAKIALSGGPGWGKTLTALSVARVLSPEGTILGIDTEHESMKLYAPPPGRPPGPGEFAFKHIAWAPPYDPRELTEAIYHYAAHVDVLIVDSLSHFWQGEGGVLDIAGGKFTGWKDARPIQRDLVEAIVRAPCHVIGCMRSKVEFTQEQGRNARGEVAQVVKRLGQADIQSDEMPYEFTLAAELDAQHQLTITKSRCRALPLGRVFAPEHETDMAATLLAWLDSAPPAEVVGNGDSPLDIIHRQDVAAGLVPPFPDGDSPLAQVVAEEGERDRPRREALAQAATAADDGPAPGSWAGRMQQGQREAGQAKRQLDETAHGNGQTEPERTGRDALRDLHLSASDALAELKAADDRFKGTSLRGLLAITGDALERAEEILRAKHGQEQAEAATS